ncbi:MAG: hypothetical protein PHD82_03825, partial [Candidatus Riflebacteria bacterium]|nr:hypothetical protein [Candidatus Riflebacteria bacterium]
MFANTLRKRALRMLAGLLVLVAVLSSQGCRQAPATEPVFYARELEQMRREEQRAAAAKETKFMKDGYPWRGKTVQPCLPCRITTTEKEISTEIKYLHETVHG